MQYIISIDTGTTTGRMLINLLKKFRQHKEVKFLTEAELEEAEDKVLGRMIDEGRTGKYVDVDKFLKKLKSK